MSNYTSEFTHGRDRLISLLQQRKVYVELPGRLCITMALAEQKSNTDLMIGSLTTRPDDLSQWRAYGDAAAGCVIGINARYQQCQRGYEDGHL